MTPWAHISSVLMSFISATPDLLHRFRDKLGTADISAWRRNNHVLWASEFIEAFAGRTLSSISKTEVERFIIRQESEHQLSRASREDMIASIRFLYQEMDGAEPKWINQLFRAKGSPSEQHVGLSRATLRTVLPLIEYQYQLPVVLIYSSGLKASESARLRVEDLLIDQGRLQLRNTEGQVTHHSILPKCLGNALKSHVEQRRQLHLKDTSQQFDGAPIPLSMSQDGVPYARSWRCQFLFAEGQLTRIANGRLIRRNFDPRRLERAIRMAADRVELGETVTAKSIRLSFARHMIHAHVPPETLQYLLGQITDAPGELTDLFKHLHSPMDELWPEGSGPWRS